MSIDGTRRASRGSLQKIATVLTDHEKFIDERELFVRVAEGIILRGLAPADAAAAAGMMAR